MIRAKFTEIGKIFKKDIRFRKKQLPGALSRPARKTAQIFKK
jgi:hypothetical protein